MFLFSPFALTLKKYILPNSNEEVAYTLLMWTGNTIPAKTTCSPWISGSRDLPESYREQFAYKLETHKEMDTVVDFINRISDKGAFVNELVDLIINLSDNLMSASLRSELIKLSDENPDLFIAKTLCHSAIIKMEPKEKRSKTIPKSSQYSLLSAYPKSNEVTFGRDDDTKHIRDELNNTGYMILCGDGGIGKTRLAMHYCQKYEKDYDSIAFLTYNEDLTDLWLQLSFSDDASFSGELGELCKRNEDRLRYLTDKTLIIIDNYDVTPEHDRILSGLLNCKFHLLVTTRVRYENAYEVSPISLDALFELFRYHYQAMEPFTKEETDKLEYVFNRLERHTLLIELLARVARSYTLQHPYELVSYLDKYDFKGYHGYDEVVPLKKDNLYTKNTIQKHVSQIFHLSDLTKDEMEVLRKLQLFKVEGSPISYFLSLIGKENLLTVEHLHELGWIKYTDGSMYPRTFTIKDEYVVPFCTTPCKYAKIHPVIGELLETKVALKKADYIQISSRLFDRGNIIGLNKAYELMHYIKYDAYQRYFINLDYDLTYSYTMFCVYFKYHLYGQCKKFIDNFHKNMYDPDSYDHDFRITILYLEHFLSYLYHSDFGTENLYHELDDLYRAFTPKCIAPFDRLHEISGAWEQLHDFIKNYSILEQTGQTLSFVLDYQNEKFIEESQQVLLNSQEINFCKNDFFSTDVTGIILLLQGKYYLAHHDHRNALKVLYKARAFYEQFCQPFYNPNLVCVCRHLGQAYNMAGDYDNAAKYYQVSIKLLRGYNPYYPISIDLPAIINYENLYLDQQLSNFAIASEEEYDDEIHRRNEIRLGDLCQEFAELHMVPEHENFDMAFDYMSQALTCYENYKHLAGKQRLDSCVKKILELEALTGKRYRTYYLITGDETPNIVHPELDK